jgi:hypothetical protein
MTMMQTESFSPSEEYNETITSWTNNTYKAITYYRGVTGITSIGNATFTLGSGNYTFYGNSTGASVLMHYGALAPNTGYNASASPGYWVVYDYSTDTDASDLLDSSNDSLGVIGDWLGILAIVIVAVVVLGLIKFL